MASEHPKLSIVELCADMYRTRFTEIAAALEARENLPFTNPPHFVDGTITGVERAEPGAECCGCPNGSAGRAIPATYTLTTTGQYAGPFHQCDDCLPFSIEYLVDRSDGQLAGALRPIIERLTPVVEAALILKHAVVIGEAWTP